MKTKNTHFTTVSTAFCALALLTVFSARAAEDFQNLQSESQQALANFLKVDPGLQKFLDEAAGHVIFPNVGKGGLVVGGAHGKGVVYERGRPAGVATMTQASIGAQVGGQTFAEIIFFETPDALSEFKTGKFEMSAEVSAVAAAEGASKAARYRHGVAVFTLPKKGLMVQASIGGQKFKFEPLQ